MGFVQELLVAARAYRDDPEQAPLFVEAINAATSHDHRTLAQVSDLTGYSQDELKTIVGE
ncbi:MAG: hypothetical protein ACLP7W_04120 [Solirubrobacteraceae bacterium]